MRSHGPDCCCLHFPVCPFRTNVVLFTYQTSLSLRCFSLVRYFLSVPAAMQDNDFLVNEQLCILFELFSGGNFSASLERSLCL